MFGLGMPEMIVIFLVVFLLFGPKALPQIAKGLGEFMRNLKKGINEVNEDIHSLDDEKKKEDQGNNKKNGGQT